MDFVGKEVIADTPQDMMSFLLLDSEFMSKEMKEQERLQKQLDEMDAFKGKKTMDHVKDERKQDAASSKLPFCPKCEGRGSTRTAKFCSSCGTQLWMKSWDEDLDALTYECVATGQTQLRTPR